MKQFEARMFFEEIVEKAEKMYSLELGELELVFDSKPEGKRTLAFYRPVTETVHLNNVLLETIDVKTIKDVIIHEISHHLTPILYPNHKQDHGREFKAIDRSLGGVGKARMFVKNFEAFAAKATIRRTATVTYMCICKKHEITKNRHTRILNGASYSCTLCGTKLKKYK